MDVSENHNGPVEPQNGLPQEEVAREGSQEASFESQVGDPNDSSELELSGEPDGEDLVEALVTFSGLPADLIHDELGRILENSGHCPSTLTLDELRSAMVQYLESMQPVLASETNEDGIIPDPENSGLPA